jgi:hypothetical protein
VPILDEVYKASSKTSILDTANERVRFIGSDTVNLYTMSLDGLGNYSRNAGFVTGSVTGGWEPYKLTQDRGRSFMVDVMDNDETMGMAFGTLAGEFIRTQVTPEIDAYRFAKYAGTSGISSGTPADITVGTTDVPTLIQNAETTMGDDEVPEEGRILFISETAYAGLKDKITRYVQNGERGIETAIDYYDGMRVIKVPKGRFNTGITLNDGLSSGETKGGFTVPASTSYPINFMIIHPSAVVQIAKHVVPRIFSPQVNQSADAWKFDYRIYHDAFVENNKVAGIYLHRAATANA